MGDVYPLKVPSSASMTWSDSYRFNPRAVNRSLPNIIPYIPLAESSTWHFHVEISVAISSGKVNYIYTFLLVVILPTCVCHCIT